MDHSRLAAGEAGDPAGAHALKRVAFLVLAAALALVASGCGRRSRYQPLPADSTHVQSADSIAALAQGAVERWDSGTGEDAARLSANLLLADFRGRPPADWAGRARARLDSLAIGAEVGSAPGAVVVNFFARSDPERGSWPYLFWNADKGGPRMQALEGRDLHFLDLVTRPGAGAQPALVAALFSRRAAAGGQPISFAWKPTAGGTYAIVQTLGADSLGGAGSGEFVLEDSTLVMRTRTYRPTRGFTECATCPHVYATHVFQWSGDGFHRLSDEEAPSPYSTFVRFIQALQANDRSAGLDQVSDGALWDQARQLDWHQPRGAWRVAPSTDETAHEMTFFRGENEAYRVSFVGRVGGWRISEIEETSRSVE